MPWNPNSIRPTIVRATDTKAKQLAYYVNPNLAEKMPEPSLAFLLILEHTTVTNTLVFYKNMYHVM